MLSNTLTVPDARCKAGHVPWHHYAALHRGTLHTVPTTSIIFVRVAVAGTKSDAGEEAHQRVQVDKLHRRPPLRRPPDRGKLRQEGGVVRPGPCQYSLQDSQVPHQGMHAKVQAYAQVFGLGR